MSFQYQETLSFVKLQTATHACGRTLFFQTKWLARFFLFTVQRRRSKDYDGLLFLYNYKSINVITWPISGCWKWWIAFYSDRTMCAKRIPPWNRERILVPGDRNCKTAYVAFIRLWYCSCLLCISVRSILAFHAF